MTATETRIEQDLIAKLEALKYTYRPDIRDREALEKNFREKFEALNRVKLTDSEFSRLRDEIVNADVFAAARHLREKNGFERDDGMPLNYTLVNITGASIGRSAIADSRITGGNVNQNELNPALLNQFLISDRGQKQIDSFQAGGNRQGLNFGQIRLFEIPLPPAEDEQRRVADSLSSLDELITAQTQKLDTLNVHEKGLMQQLFPNQAGE